MSAMSKTILVTGGNSGIGAALCKLLATEHACRVLLGARSPEKGEKAKADIVAKYPDAKIDVVTIDVASDSSVAAAAAAVKAMGVTLYALVNNAGLGLAQADNDAHNTAAVMNVNYAGPKRVTDAFVPLIQPDGGRVVNVSSGAASAWVKGQDAATKKLYSTPGLTQAQLDASVAKEVAAGNVGWGDGYGISKAALTALTLVQAAAHPKLVVVSLSPGFIMTPMTVGYGAKLSPEEGCKSSIKCLFGDVVSGLYYGSDGLRSPMTVSRDPGTPEYAGEDDPDPAKYNK
jgi:NAD(P)-dependent dehydrogenase (short-subunit alcohol dehydrogenase family)